MSVKLLIFILFLLPEPNLTTQEDHCKTCLDPPSPSWVEFCKRNCPKSPEKVPILKALEVGEDSPEPAMAGGWKVDWKSLTGDPEKWSADLQSQVMLAVACAIMLAMLKAPITWALAGMIAFLGVKANPIWVVAVGVAYWGYRKSRYIIVAGALYFLWSSYKGYTFVKNLF